MALVWASLALAIVLTTIGIVILFRHAVRLWRDLRKSGKALADGLDDLGRRVDEMSVRAERLEAAMARPGPGLARLRITLARFAVLRAAMADVQDAVGRVSAVYPRK
jgi:hypothetical protein